jgi:hypothetical protein
MTQKYYNIRIRIANADNVQLEIYDTSHGLLGEPGGSFAFKDKNRTRIIELQVLLQPIIVLKKSGNTEI